MPPRSSSAGSAKSTKSAKKASPKVSPKKSSSPTPSKAGSKSAESKRGSPTPPVTRQGSGKLTRASSKASEGGNSNASKNSKMTGELLVKLGEKYPDASTKILSAALSESKYNLEEAEEIVKNKLTEQQELAEQQQAVLPPPVRGSVTPSPVGTPPSEAAAADALLANLPPPPVSVVGGTQPLPDQNSMRESIKYLATTTNRSVAACGDALHLAERMGGSQAEHIQRAIDIMKQEEDTWVSRFQQLFSVYDPLKSSEMETRTFLQTWQPQKDSFEKIYDAMCQVYDARNDFAWQDQQQQQLQQQPHQHQHQHQHQQQHLQQQMSPTYPPPPVLQNSQPQQHLQQQHIQHQQQPVLPGFQANYADPVVGGMPWNVDLNTLAAMLPQLTKAVDAIEAAERTETPETEYIEEEVKPATPQAQAPPPPPPQSAFSRPQRSSNFEQEILDKIKAIETALHEKDKEKEREREREKQEREREATLKRKTNIVLPALPPPPPPPPETPDVLPTADPTMLVMQSLTSQTHELQQNPNAPLGAGINGVLASLAGVASGSNYGQLATKQRAVLEQISHQSDANARVVELERELTDLRERYEESERRQKEQLVVIETIQGQLDSDRSILHTGLSQLGGINKWSSDNERVIGESKILQQEASILRRHQQQTQAEPTSVNEVAELAALQSDLFNRTKQLLEENEILNARNPNISEVPMLKNEFQNANDRHDLYHESLRQLEILGGKSEPPPPPPPPPSYPPPPPPIQHQSIAPIQHQSIAPIQHQSIAPIQHQSIAPMTIQNLQPVRGPSTSIVSTAPDANPEVMAELTNLRGVLKLLVQHQLEQTQHQDEIARVQEDLIEKQKIDKLQSVRGSAELVSSIRRERALERHTDRNERKQERDLERQHQARQEKEKEKERRRKAARSRTPKRRDSPSRRIASEVLMHTARSPRSRAIEASLNSISEAVQNLKSSSPASTDDPSNHRALLVSFYTRHDPAKLDSVDTILERFRGHDTTLFHSLAKKYNIPLSPYRDKLIQFYSKHNPAKLCQVDIVLHLVQGNEDRLLRKLEEKYLGSQ